MTDRTFIKRRERPPVEPPVVPPVVFQPPPAPARKDRDSGYMLSGHCSIGTEEACRRCKGSLGTPQRPAYCRCDCHPPRT